MARTNCPHGLYTDECQICQQAWKEAEDRKQKDKTAKFFQNTMSEAEWKAQQNATAKTSTSILAEAQSVIYGDREKTYGRPDKNLQVIADMWNAYLGRAEIVGSMHKAITTDDVCVMMILLKAARLKNQPNHRDSQVDICGYAALMERVQEFKKNERNTATASQAAPSKTEIFDS